jgi:hypothetical protein
MNDSILSDIYMQWTDSFHSAHVLCRQDASLQDRYQTQIQKMAADSLLESIQEQPKNIPVYDVPHHIKKKCACTFVPIVDAVHVQARLLSHKKAVEVIFSIQMGIGDARFKHKDWTFHWNPFPSFFKGVKCTVVPSCCCNTEDIHLDMPKDKGFDIISEENTSTFFQKNISWNYRYLRHIKMIIQWNQ